MGELEVPTPDPRRRHGICPLGAHPEEADHRRLCHRRRGLAGRRAHRRRSPVRGRRGWREREAPSSGRPAQGSRARARACAGPAQGATESEGGGSAQGAGRGRDVPVEAETPPSSHSRRRRGQARRAARGSCGRTHSRAAPRGGGDRLRRANGHPAPPAAPLVRLAIRQERGAAAARGSLSRARSEPGRWRSVQPGVRTRRVGFERRTGKPDQPGNPQATRYLARPADQAWGGSASRYSITRRVSCVGVEAPLVTPTLCVPLNQSGSRSSIRSTR